MGWDGMAASLATWELLDRYDNEPQGMSRRWESMVVAVLLRHGSRSDAEVLLPAFLDDPESRAHLVPVLAKHGDISTAEHLLDACVIGDRLRAGVPSSVLHAVGYLGYEPAERTLWNHIEPPYGGEHGDDACLGLLHLSCRGLRTEIGAALCQHLGANLFPELLPALATRTGDRSWLGKLVNWGEDGASTDCNGGLILGIALHADGGHAEFIRLLWNPSWEAYGGGTGSDYWAYAGARVLGLSMSQLYSDLRTRVMSGSDVDLHRHCLRAFTALLRYWVGQPWLGLRMTPDPAETYDARIDLLFEWSTPDEDDSLIGLAGRVLARADPILDDLHQLKQQLRIRSQHTMELRVVTAEPNPPGEADRR